MGSGCSGGHYVPWCSGWVGPTVLLCLFGFFSMLRPIEPFLTNFLTGTNKNLTTEQVTTQVYPVWTYSSLVLLIPVLMVTDLLRYKPVIVLQGLCYVGAFLLVLVGPGVRLTQLALFIYSIATAGDVAYFSYIYVVVDSSRYQRVTSYVRGAVLLGYAMGGLLAQLLVSLGGVSLYCLAVMTLISVSIALVTTGFLPMPKTNLFLCEQPHQAGIVTGAKVPNFRRIFRDLIQDCKKCYSSTALLFFCLWSAAGRCGFYQVTGYVQLLWVHIQPQNFTAYNGAVDALGMLTGAAATVAVGHVSEDWSVWWELVLGVFTLLIAAAVFLMAKTDNIWISYTFYILFKTVYMQLITICTFQIAKALSRRRYALVFGVNSFVGTVLQSVLTAIVINTGSLHLTITSQFFVYASFFAAMSLLFTVRGVYTVLIVKRAATGREAERSGELPQLSRP